jgi:hypothetical protein
MQHLALQQYFSHPKLFYWLDSKPLTQKHELETLKDSKLLIANHLDQSIYLTNQEQMLDCACDFRQSQNIGKNADPHHFTELIG